MIVGSIAEGSGSGGPVEFELPALLLLGELGCETTLNGFSCKARCSRRVFLTDGGLLGDLVTKNY